MAVTTQNIDFGNGYFNNFVSVRLPNGGLVQYEITLPCVFPPPENGSMYPMKDPENDPQKGLMIMRNDENPQCFTHPYAVGRSWSAELKGQNSELEFGKSYTSETTFETVLYPLADWHQKWSTDYPVVADEEGVPCYSMNLPQNIVKTGIKGRGQLGKWGANFAADPVVTRWSRDANGEIVYEDDFPVLEIVVITRNSDAGYGEFALPGGMVENGESVSATIKREFGEEAMNSDGMDDETKAKMNADLANLFANGIVVYKGSTNDPRQTDNAWIETTAMNFHDTTGVLNAIKLKAGSDASTVSFMPITPKRIQNGTVKLYANHRDIVMATYGYQRCMGNHGELKR